MSDSLQFFSRIGADGVLNVSLNLGPSEASKEVVVTVQPLPESPREVAPPESPQAFVARTYGSCAPFEIEHFPEGEYEHREPLS